MAAPIDVNIYLYRTRCAPDFVRNFLKKSSLSYSLFHQLFARQNPVKIGPAVTEISRNKQTNKNSKLFGVCTRYMHLVTSCYFNVSNTPILFICID